MTLTFTTGMTATVARTSNQNARKGPKFALEAILRRDGMGLPTNGLIWSLWAYMSLLKNGRRARRVVAFSSPDRGGFQQGFRRRHSAAAVSRA